MKRAKKLMPTLLLLAFIICAVGIGIHSLHRDAYAQMTRSCDIWNIDANLGQGGWCTDAVVQFRRETAPDIWDDWEDAWLVDGAHYFFPFDDFGYRWQVRLSATGSYTGSFPGGDVQTFNNTDPTNFYWEVEER